MMPLALSSWMQLDHPPPSAGCFRRRACRALTPAILPRPDDARIRLVTLPPERQAVVIFSGLPRTADLEARAERLRGWIAAKGLRVAAGPHFQFYDSPMTLPWNRRNEVSFTIE